MDDNALPYTWEDALPPVSEVLQLWTEVGNGLDKNQTGRFIVLCEGAVYCVCGGFPSWFGLL